MKLKLKYKKNGEIIAWIQKKKDLDEIIKITCDVFKDSIKSSNWGNIFRYHKVSSKKPNMMMIFISNVQDSIMEYFDPNYVNEELNYLDDPLDDFD